MFCKKIFCEIKKIIIKILIFNKKYEICSFCGHFAIFYGNFSKSWSLGVKKSFLSFKRALVFYKYV
jgi:hypothetical protein